MYMQVDLYKQMEDRRRAEKRRDAELSWLLKQGKRYPQHWLPRQGCWVLCQAGRWMVRAGQALQQAGAFPSGQMMP
jgi:hypothetical protein